SYAPTLNSSTAATRRQDFVLFSAGYTSIVISRRAVLALPFGAACTSHRPGFRGYAFVANEEGQAVAAVDLQALAVARHIPLDSSPVDVLALRTRPFVYALTPAN